MKISPLSCDPFEGDFGDQGDITLSDKMVVAKKEHKCVWCHGTIKIGEIYRSRTDKIDGELNSYHWCPACCAAMVADIKSGNCDATSERINND